jgi:hypothetical protein
MSSSTSGTFAVRHVEKRRISTCPFADRVAEISVDRYRQLVPSEYRQAQQACLATFVAHEADSDRLWVIALGVGTKFLTEAVLESEQRDNSVYGTRVRDCHAEALARRALLRYLALEIETLVAPSDTEPSNAELQPPVRLLENCRALGTTNPLFRIRPGITLHMYTSSAPCGNAVLKKFATFQREVFRDLPPEQWPSEPHPPMPGHAIPFGQFALLVKHDATAAIGRPSLTIDPSTSASVLVESGTAPLDGKLETNRSASSGKGWPAQTTTDWCPPGTSTVWKQAGSIHTCSDKLLRWNLLGLQGALLSSYLSAPVFATTLTVGRKLSNVCCRRAVCCRAVTKTSQRKPSNSPTFPKIHHPAILGTAVYLDETGIVDMASSRQAEGQDVRFHSTRCWVWCASGMTAVECLDGSTGFLWPEDTTDCQQRNKDGQRTTSLVCTLVLTELLVQLRGRTSSDARGTTKAVPQSLPDLLALKQRVSPRHEQTKQNLLSRHPLLRQWKQRGSRCTT